MNTQILLHNINYTWFDGSESRELDETDINHIKSLINEEYREGELCQGDERGWWKIVFN